jgi:hypothetical protein
MEFNALILCAPFKIGLTMRPPIIGAAAGLSEGGISLLVLRNITSPVHGDLAFWHGVIPRDVRNGFSETADSERRNYEPT